MQIIGSKVRSIGLLGAVAACCVLAGDRASAAPPPPRFEGFEIVNGCPNDIVRGIRVEFYRGDESMGCWAIENTPAATLQVPSLSPGEVVHLDIPGLWGVARIRVTSTMPLIDAAPNPFDLVSDKVDADDVPPAETYTGFTSEAPQGSVPVTPRLQFNKPEGPGFEVTISGSSRWGNHYSPVITAVRNVP